jgi:hypothetical protein
VVVPVAPKLEALYRLDKSETTQKVVEKYGAGHVAFCNWKKKRRETEKIVVLCQSFK